MLKLYEVSYDLQLQKKLWPAKEYIVANNASQAKAAFDKEQAWRDRFSEFDGRAIHVRIQPADTEV